MAEGLLPPPSTSVSDIMTTAKGVFRLTLAKCLPLALFAALFYGLPVMALLARGKLPDMATYTQGAADDPTFWWLSIIGFVVAQFCSAALLYRQKLMTMRGLPRDHEDLRRAARRLPGIVLAMLPGQVVGSVAFAALLSLLKVGFAPGLLLILLPSIYLAVCWLLVRPMMMLEPVTPWGAWIRCVKLVQPIWVRALTVALFAWLILFISLLAALALLSILLSLGGGAVTTAAGGLALSPMQNAIGSAVVLGLMATGLVYLNAIWLALHAAAAAHSAASSSA